MLQHAKEKSDYGVAHPQLAAAPTFGVQLPHYFTDLGQAAEVESAILLIYQAAGSDLDHLQMINHHFVRVSSLGGGKMMCMAPEQLLVAATHYDQHVTAGVQR